MWPNERGLGLSCEGPIPKEENALACKRQGLDSRARLGSWRSARWARARGYYFVWRCPYRVHKMSSREDLCSVNDEMNGEIDIIVRGEGAYSALRKHQASISAQSSSTLCAPCQVIFSPRVFVSVSQRTYHHTQTSPMMSPFRCSGVPSPLPHKLPFNQATLTNHQVPSPSSDVPHLF
jgi:hypothetical protein